MKTLLATCTWTTVISGACLLGISLVVAVPMALVLAGCTYMVLDLVDDGDDE